MMILGPLVGGTIARVLVGNHASAVPSSVTMRDIFPVHDTFLYGDKTYTREDVQRLRQTIKCPDPPKRQV